MSKTVLPKPDTLWQTRHSDLQCKSTLFTAVMTFRLISWTVRTVFFFFKSLEITKLHASIQLQMSLIFRQLTFGPRKLAIKFAYKEHNSSSKRYFSRRVPKSQHLHVSNSSSKRAICSPFYTYSWSTSQK